MNIKYSSTFKKQYKKAPILIQKKIQTRLNIFIQNPTNVVLNNHALTGKLEGRRSINITGNWRVIYSVRKNPDSEREYYFELVGTHNQLYR